MISPGLQYTRVPSFLIFSGFGIFSVLYLCHSNMGVVVSPYGFSLHFPNAYLYNLSSEVIIQVLCPFFFYYPIY